MANFTKADLANQLSAQAAMPKRSAMLVIDALLSIIKAETDAGKTVTLSGFGKFAIKERAAREGRNPRTGEPIAIEARRVVTFHASQKLKAIVQGELPAATEQD
jgi:integration host factor subunit alpha